MLNDFTVNCRDRIENYLQFKQIMDKAAKVYVKLGDLCLYYNERVEMFCGIGKDATLEVDIEGLLDSIQQFTSAYYQGGQNETLFYDFK